MAIAPATSPTSAEAVPPPDYSLVGPSARRAVERGLAEATWYACPVPRDEMRRLLERRDGPAIIDTVIWFGLLAASGLAGFLLWGSWWAIVPFIVYGVIYGTTSDSRWHESSHGTAFKTDWMNNALYEIASFMVMRESTVWRWSHTRHHSDTIIVGRDPEIAVQRPPSLPLHVANFFALPAMRAYFKALTLHCLGRLSAEEATFIPESERATIFFKARVSMAIYLVVVGLALYQRSILPLMYIGLPNIYGAWLMPIYGYTQHAGLAENVLDHRLNCRTVHMHPIHRYLYWNMNYHLEHHMFPLVPYHQLPRLHKLIKDDCPPAYPSILAAWKEIVPAVLRQRKDPGYYVKRALPAPSSKGVTAYNARIITASGSPDAAGWLAVCPADALHREDVLRLDYAQRTFAIYRTADDQFHATDGICTHGRTHLADGLVKGNLIECPKHNGRFDVRDGSPQRPPVCVGLKTYPVENRAGTLWINVSTAGGCGAKAEQQTYGFRVVSNRNVATFIKELVLEPEDPQQAMRWTPGDYLQLDIPAYGTLDLGDVQVEEPFASAWRTGRVHDAQAHCDAPVRRNYSIATAPDVDRLLRFNVRIALPPTGQDCPAGSGSAYVFSLKPGDRVTAIGPFGDFHIKPTRREMVYIGGGAGMAPLRAHLAHLFEHLRSTRTVSFWYGARSKMELFYTDYFAALEREHRSFRFHVALSDPRPGDDWNGPVGFIHEVVEREFLATHPDPTACEYYLCGPPAMIKATRTMLARLGVASEQISYDEF